MNLNTFRLVLIILISFLLTFQPVTVFAQTEQEVPQFSLLYKGQPAPYDGFLFNYLATATIIETNQFQEKLFQEKLDYSLATQEAEFKLKLNKLDTSYQLEIEENSKINKLKDDELEKLRKTALKTNNTIWWSVGAFAVGVASTIAIIFAVNGVQK